MSQFYRNVPRAILVSCLLWTGSWTVSFADEALRAEAARALQKSVDFFTSKVSTHGGYVYMYSADLSKREGEGKTTLDTLWVQPPGTPAVGLAYLEAYERTQAPYLLTAARAAGECLVRGQLRSGGWAASMDFDETGRQKSAYRVDAERKKLGSNWTTFDDNKTQSALTFLMRLDQVLKFQDATIHEAALFALDSVLKAQYPNGAFPQGYQEFPDPTKFPVKKASYPGEWPRKFPGEKYQLFYTFNDNALADTIDMLFLASRIYQDSKYRDSAIKAGGFILLAQMPEPQPAWAQQYNFDMHPVWARKFEPPSISGGESQGILRILLSLYRETGDAKFLAPIEPALKWLQRSQLPDGRLARFYELQTNKPLYFTKQYELTYDSSDMPTHYGFIVSSSVDRIQREYEKLRSATPKELEAQRQAASRPSTGSAPSDKQVRAIIDSLDERGAWVEDGRLSHHGDSDDTRRVISCRTFIKNIAVLSRYASASKQGN
jgi:PelA/Pel-15E family pectate lyase